MNVGPILFNMIGNLVPGNIGKDDTSSAPAKGSSGSPPSTLIVAQAAPPPAAAPNPPAPSFVTVPDQTPQDFTRYCQRKINGLNIAATQTDIRNYKADARDRTQARWRRELAQKQWVNLTSELGEKYILNWLHLRNLGKSQNALLSNGISKLFEAESKKREDWRRKRLVHSSGITKRLRFWSRQLPLILSSELKNPFMANQLKRIIGDSNGWFNEKDPRKREKKALELFFKDYLKNGARNFALFRGETLFRLALLAKSLGKISEYRELRRQAKTYLGQILHQKRTRTRNRYIPNVVLANREELPKHLAWANLWMANILVQESDGSQINSIKLKLLARAKTYLKKTAALAGIARLEARNLAAGISTREGYIMKNQNKPFIAYFEDSKKHLDYIQKWAADYIRKIKRGAGRNLVIPRWLVNITTAAKISQAKFLMALLGEVRLKSSLRLLKLFTEKLTPAERTRLEAGVSKVDLLKIHAKVLRGIARDLKKAQAKKYIYTVNGKPDPDVIVQFEARADLKLALAENLARQAFIAKDLGNNGLFTELLEGRKVQPSVKGALTYLNEIFKPPGPFRFRASELTRTIANLWYAKIYFVMAGSAETSQERKDRLADAEKHIGYVLTSKKLRGPMLSSAYQTKGDILLLQKNLTGAEKTFKQALALDARNYDALAGLADIYNQQAKHRKALKLYVKLRDRADRHLLLRRARLGIAEIRMRHQENYEPEKIQKLFELATDIFRHEPPGSYLIIRAINDLIEAYSTREKLQGNIVQIGNTLLGLRHENGTDPKLAASLKILQDRNVKLSLGFKALLYLKLAEATSWQQKFTRAKKILKNIKTDKSLSAIWKHIQRDQKLNLLYRLLEAELAMRDKRTKNIRPIMNEKLKKDVNASRDPDLVTRLMKGRIEGLFIKKKFRQAVRLIDRYLNKLNAIKILFVGRDRSFTKFQFKLWKSKADALAWSKQYSLALNQLGFILGEALKITKKYPDLAELYRAQVRLAGADVYRYQKNYAKAIKNYDTAISLLATMRSKQSKVDLAKAYFGLAEIRRYGKGGYIDLDKSREFYLKARKLALDEIPPQNPVRQKLLDDISDGLWEIKLIQKDHDQIQAGFNLTCGKNGGTGQSRCESQFLVEGDLSLGILGLAHPKLRWLRRLHLVLNGQFDLASRETHYDSVFMGLRFYPLIHPAASLTLEGTHKLYTGGSGEESIFYRRHDLRLNAFFWSRIASLGVAANLLYRETKNEGATKPWRLNTYYAMAMVNFAWSENPWLKGLSLGAVFNSYPFFWDSIRRDHSLAFGLQWKVKPFAEAEWLEDKGVKWLEGLEFQAHLMPFMYGNDQSWRNNDLKPGMDLGFGLAFNIKKRFLLEASYSHQWTQEYPMHRFMFNLQWKSDLSEIFVKK